MWWHIGGLICLILPSILPQIWSNLPNLVLYLEGTTRSVDIIAGTLKFQVHLLEFLDLQVYLLKV